jgi:hypothetical protein
MSAPEMKLPKMNPENFQLSEAFSRFPFPFPHPIDGDPAFILRFLEQDEIRQVVAAYAHFQAATAEAAVNLYKAIEKTAGAARTAARG